MAEWFTDETFWIEFYPYIFKEERLQIAEAEVEKALALVHFPGGAVLDLCCGPGRHTVALAKRGLQVTGVDRSPFLLEKAKERARAAQVNVEFIQADMRHFVRPEAFDLVLNLFTSFGYFDDKEEDRKVLHNIYQSLKPSGVCVMDMVGKEWLAKVFQPTRSSENPDRSLLVERTEIVDDWTRVRNEWILIKEGQARSFRFHLTIYSGQELKDRLLGVGFHEVKFYGDLDGNAYGLNASRLVAVARKHATA